MADLLIHSMAEFADLLLDCLDAAGAREVVEVGAETGAMTRRLLERAAAAGGSLVSIDPAPSPEAAELFASHPRARLVRDLSLNALGTLAADAWLIDGDHNYYTVLHESRLIRESCRRSGRPLLVFYHDVTWPCARRDFYYDPERIPPEFRHDHVWDLGVVLDDPGVTSGGFRGMGQWACALWEGGPRNGVLTAVEDFAASVEEELAWAVVPAVFGLGVLFERRAPWAGALEGILRPYHRNRLLERLEQNRLECYLKLIA